MGVDAARDRPPKDNRGDTGQRGHCAGTMEQRARPGHERGAVSFVLLFLLANARFQ